MAPISPAPSSAKDQKQGGVEFARLALDLRHVARDIEGIVGVLAVVGRQVHPPPHHAQLCPSGPGAVPQSAHPCGFAPPRRFPCRTANAKSARRCSRSGSGSKGPNRRDRNCVEEAVRPASPPPFGSGSAAAINPSMSADSAAVEGVFSRGAERARQHDAAGQKAQHRPHRRGPRSAARQGTQALSRLAAHSGIFKGIAQARAPFESAPGPSSCADAR